MNIERAVRAIIDAQARARHDRDSAILVARVELGLEALNDLRVLASYPDNFPPPWLDARLYGIPAVPTEELGLRGWRVLAANGDVLAGGGCNALGDELCELLGHRTPEDCVERATPPHAGLVLD